MKIFSSLGKPEYIYRPSQIVRRVQRDFERRADAVEVVLPWSLPITVNPNECIGSVIWRTGLYDLCVSESLWRLLDPGELAVDVGANIGHMSGLMALRVGHAGRVMSFEPHPGIFKALFLNTERWRLRRTLGRFDLYQFAVSSSPGKTMLHIPRDFGLNQGLASLEESASYFAASVQVDRVTLDDIVTAGMYVGVMKMDIEGHELSALRGAQQIFEQKRVRDLVFEEHEAVPTPVTAWLEQRGYHLFTVMPFLSGPKIKPMREMIGRPSGEAPSLIATTDPARAVRRMKSFGWQVLSKRKVI